MYFMSKLREAIEDVENLVLYLIDIKLLLMPYPQFSLKYITEHVHIMLN